MEVDPSSSSPGAGEGGGGGIGGGGGDLWPFDSLTTSLLFSSVSASPQPLPASSSSWLTPPSPLWLFDERQLLPLDMGAPAAPATAPPAEAAAVVEEVHRTRSGNSDTTSKRVDQINSKWQFHLSIDDNTDSSCLFKERLTQALRYFKESTDQHLLVQVWAPVKSGDRYVLTTSGQPFVLDQQSIGLLQYRAVSMMYMFSVDGENAGDLGLPGRVYKQKVPEWTPNVQYYSSTEYPRLNHAISYNVHGTVALPVFDPSVQNCIAVVELIMTSKKINYAGEVDKVCKALEAVNLKSTEILDHPNVQICNEGRQSALVEILEILTVVCEEHKLPLAQTWVPCKYRSVLAHGGGVKKSCLSFDGSCMGEVCMSTSDVAFHVIDAHMWGFRDACVEHHLQKGQGVSGKAFIYRRPCFSKDISQFCKLEYPLVHYARMFGLAGCFAICLQSMYTGDDDYILEFFLPPNCRNEDDQNALLESILARMKKCLRTLKVVGNGDTNEVCLQISNVLIIETEDLKTNVHFENSEGCFRESPESNGSQRAHEVDNDGNKVSIMSERHLLADDNSQNNGASVGRPNGSGASDSLHKSNKPPERRRGKAEKTISLDVLQQYFSGSLKNAAKSLGVCPTTMKRICRQHGISRWPSRKINKVNRSLSKLKQVIESVQGSDAAFNLTSITGPLPIPVGPSSDSQNLEKASPNKVAELSNLAVEGDRDSSLQKPIENDGNLAILMSQQGFIDANNNLQLEADKASHSRSSSGEGSINSRTSEASCQGSPANQTFVCKPIASTFAEPQLIPEAFTKEPFQEPALPLSRMLIEDSGSSKDLKNLFTSAVDQPFLARSSNLALMQNSGTVTIKASFKEDIVRFRFPCSGSVTALKDEVAKRLRMDVGMFDIKYLDDDHEWVKLACNADLEECMEISRHSGSHVIRLLVSDVAAHLGSSCGSSG
uniref:RWP-RK domain-containing protein n=1 Tax=Oryza glumipatula TaxID=40148 RepID=A0A0D9Y5S9_9ORYZ